MRLTFMVYDDPEIGVLRRHAIAHGVVVDAVMVTPSVRDHSGRHLLELIAQVQDPAALPSGATKRERTALALFDALSSIDGVDPNARLPRRPL